MHELITERNMTEGMHILFVYVNDVTGGLFIKALLISIWMIVTMGIYFSQKKSVGRGDFPMCVAVGGFVVVVFASIFRIVPGLLDTLTFSIAILLALLGIAYFFYSKD